MAISIFGETEKVIKENPNTIDEGMNEMDKMFDSHKYWEKSQKKLRQEN